MADLCQTDYARVRAGDYFPDTLRDGTCAACAEETFVARVSADEAASARAEIEAELHLLHHDGHHNQRGDERCPDCIAEAEYGNDRLDRSLFGGPAYSKDEDSVWAREERRLRDYDDGFIAGDDR